MLKQDYFKLCMDHDCYRSKAWVISAFGLVLNAPQFKDGPFRTSGERTAEQLRIKRTADGQPYFNDPTTSEKVSLEDYVFDATDPAPVFRFKDPVRLKAGDCLNLKQAIDTTYGAWLFNQIVAVYPFGEKIAYSANGYTIVEIEKIIEGRLTDTPTEEELLRDPPSGDPLQQPIYVSEYIRYNEAAGALTGYTQLCVPAATPYTLTTSPEVLKRRDELFKEYQGRLDDPLVQARISEELVKLDRAWIEQDPEKGFYYRAKSFEVVRKKLLLFQGAESGFGVTGSFVPKSLDEGMTVEALTASINAARSGSFSRGALTALGGEMTKYALRMFQNTTVVPEDCGATIGKPIRLTKGNVADYIGNYLIVAGQPVLITEESSKVHLDKDVEVRSPIFCHAEGVNFCAVCVGAKIAQTPEALATYASDVGSAFMLIEMGKMHGTALKLVPFDLGNLLT